MGIRDFTDTLDLTDIDDFTYIHESADIHDFINISDIRDIRETASKDRALSGWGEGRLAPLRLYEKSISRGISKATAAT